jgi:transcription antitermination protein NusB
MNKSRRRARQDAVIYLYQSDLLKKNIASILEVEELFGRDVDSFTKELIDGVINNSVIIDEKIKSIVENWSFERIAIIDRNIIRVAVFEMMYIDEIPLKVSVDEAIEIAKIFGQKDDTPKFVNGILGKILSEMDSDQNRR